MLMARYGHLFFTLGPFHAGTNQFVQWFAVHYVTAVEVLDP